MTLPNDFIRLRFRNGEAVNIAMQANGMHWPPPETFELLGAKWQQTRMSKLGEDAPPMIARGAEYEEVPHAVLGSD